MLPASQQFSLHSETQFTKADERQLVLRNLSTGVIKCSGTADSVQKSELADTMGLFWTILDGAEMTVQWAPSILGVRGRSPHKQPWQCFPSIYAAFPFQMLENMANEVVKLMNLIDFFLSWKVMSRGLRGRTRYSTA